MLQYMLKLSLSHGLILSELLSTVGVVEAEEHSLLLLLEEFLLFGQFPLFKAFLAPEKVGVAGCLLHVLGEVQLDGWVVSLILALDRLVVS